MHNLIIQRVLGITVSPPEDEANRGKGKTYHLYIQSYAKYNFSKRVDCLY